ncbi:MAG: KH domain-containing protein [Sulfurospirillaceae bacterium]|nr:KH domain-containing protein [Sulfurospirillaceae bacterium]MDD3463592.1 KH domain-containing protein [Sulfurospirillaceae bacterium]
MIEKFLEEFAKLFVDAPENVRVEKNNIDDAFCEVIIYADKVDTGKLIGKDGKMINSLKTLISGCKAKDGKSYRVTVKANNE